MSARAIANLRSYSHRQWRPLCFAPQVGVRWSSTLDRQYSTPLAKSLTEAITTTGPISIANYMRQCLTSPEDGFYTTQSAKGKDQFGKAGDFITSPEISQIFGELVGIWFVAEWMAQGKRSQGVQLVELGPGRGTLMDDVLRTVANFKPMASSIETIYLIEASPNLRAAQHKLLCGTNPLKENEQGHESISKRLPNTKIIWVEDIEFMPKEQNKTPLLIAHEFFDALPIHAFQSTPTDTLPNLPNITTSSSTTPPAPSRSPPQNEWRELLVSPTAPPSPFSRSSTHSAPRPEFELTLSPRPTPHSRLLPSLSPRYAPLLPTAGSTIEISPSAIATASTIAILISGSAGGAALLIDYGPHPQIPINSLRGIRGHARVSPFETAGRADVSADVDFGAVVEAALRASRGVECHGPVEQAGWLGAMGGMERRDAIVGRKGERERVHQAWDRLVDRGVNGMGRLYKVLAIVPVSEGGRKPVGFGGGVDA